MVSLALNFMVTALLRAFVPGEQKPNEEGDFWADHDEDAHGPYEDMLDEFPEGFLWSCCDKVGDQPGCHIGPHAGPADD